MLVARLVTGGRGTRLSADNANQYPPATSDNYIAASYVADGSLALIYFSAGCGANTITINQSKMQAGYTATWVDPTNGNKHAATVGSTYSAGTAQWQKCCRLCRLGAGATSRLSSRRQ